MKTEWGGPAYFSSFDSQSRGIAIFIKKDLPFQLLDSFSDIQGNILAILVKLEDKTILVQGTYGPNRDDPNFYSVECFQKLQQWNPDFAILAADWNIALDPTMDTLNYHNNNNPRARIELMDKMSELDLIDVYRELNPNVKNFTWRQWGNAKFSRLDYFLISNSLLPFIHNVDILPACYSDHCPILLEIDFAKFSRGKGFWKMNNSLLSDQEYVGIIKRTIKKVVGQYSTNKEAFNPQHDMPSETLEDFIAMQTPETLQSLPLEINPELFLDTLLMEIRGVTISYSAQKKRERNADEQLLNHDIEILEKQLQDGNANNMLREELDNKKNALENIYNYQAHGAFIRSRANYKIDGEKPTRLFCSLEKYRGVKKYVPQLVVTDNDGNENLISNQKAVENEIHTYYCKLFENRDDKLGIDSIEAFLGPHSNIVRLTERQKTSMDGKITVDEMTKYLKKCKNNVAPGSSGFTNEFFKFFWRDIKYFVINCVDYIFEQNRLPVTQRLGIVSIIPKGDKDKRYLTNWRPLTLLNTLYKLISGCIADRIKTCLPDIIHPDQKGFVAGRYIGEVIRTTYDIINHAKERKLDGLLLTVDFEKAYDSVSFSFITKCLKFFNFSDDLIKWVKILLHDFKGVINHCGNISESFSIGRGCRQGDPIASYLFILCIEILAHRLRADDEVQGLNLSAGDGDRDDGTHPQHNLHHLLEIYADDLTIFIAPNRQNLYNVINILNDFFQVSGLKISASKTKAVWFGKKYDTEEILCPELGLKWVKSFSLLGIEFDNNLENMNTNFNEKIEKMEEIFNSWNYRYLTPFGKVTVIKSLGLSKLSHIAIILPNPTKEMIKRIEKMFYKFLWGGGSEKVRREDTKLPLNFGGFSIPDINKFWSAVKFSWFRRLLTSNSFWPRLVLNSVSKVLNTETSLIDIFQLGATKIAEISKSLYNQFWKQVFSTAPLITEGALFTFPEKIISSPLFHNPQVLRQRVIKPTNFPELVQPGITLSYFFYPGTNIIMEWEDFKTRHNIEIDYEKYIDLRFTIKTAIAKLRLPMSKLYPVNFPEKPLLIDIALLTTKGCGLYYKLLTKKSNYNNKIHIREKKWHLELDQQFSIGFWNKARKFYAAINFDNTLKWLQFQIVRNSLQTNYIVHHFIPNIPSTCSYCQQLDSLEKISHLFWSCSKVSEFLGEVFIFISSTGIIPNFKPTKIQFLFGIFDESFHSLKNYIMLTTKKYIWQTKFKNVNLTMVGFKNMLKSYVSDMILVFKIRNKPDQLSEEWDTLLNLL